MNFDRSLLFSYLEEDNIQRAYFRVRPLLTMQGDIRAEAEQLWPNEGCLRIVPDRNEQHTFKVRMRTLGAYCVVDLRNQPADAGKIRTNKNFRPDKGEVNQYILYSDTVHALPEHTFYQIVDGACDAYAKAAEEAITPLFYLRDHDTLYGPVRKQAPEQPSPAKEAAGMLFDIPCPDGVNRLILCMDDEPVSEAPACDTPEVTTAAEAPCEAPAPIETVQTPPAVPVTAQTTLPIAEKLDILDQSKTHEETLRQLDKPVSSSANLLHTVDEAHPGAIPFTPSEALAGTPLVRTPVRVSVQQTKNRTQEVVTNQWSVGKYEPPAASLPNGTRMRQVVNPVENACAAMKDAWNGAGSHEQLTDFILSLDGARSLLEKKLCNGSSVTILQRVLRDRLQDLEAERLTALCELDKANRDVDAYKQELLAGMASRLRRDMSALTADKDAAAARLDSLKNEINALTKQRDGLLARINELQSDALPEAIAGLAAQFQMTAPVNGIPLRLTPVCGVLADKEALISRLMNAVGSSGVTIDRNTAIALLALMGISPLIGLACAAPAPLATLVRNVMNAFGWQDSFAHQIAAEQKPLCGIRPVDGTPAVLMTSLPNYAPRPDAMKLCLNRNVPNLVRNAAYDANPWPILPVPALPYIAEAAENDVQPISAASLEAFAAAEHASDDEIAKVITPILNAALPLSGAARRNMNRFISVCAGEMEGGLPVAIDWAIMLWVVPALERGTRQHSAVKALLDEYPLSLSRM